MTLAAIVLALATAQDIPGGAYAFEGAPAWRAVNDGCYPSGTFLECPLIPGTYAYSVVNGVTNVRLTNYGGTRRITRVQTATFPGLWWWTEESAYLNFFGTCPAPPGHCSGSNLPEDRCPCQVDADPGEGIRPVGAVGNMSIDDKGRTYPDLTWGERGVSMRFGDFFVLGDKYRGAPGTMYAVTVEDGPGWDYVFRQPKVDHVVMCNGAVQVNAFEPWGPMPEDITLTGAQVYAVGGNGPKDNRSHVTYACFYVFDEIGKPPVWSLCGNKGTATTDGYPETPGAAPRPGNFIFTKDVKKGQFIVWHAANVCTPGYAWDGVASITARSAQ